MIRRETLYRMRSQLKLGTLWPHESLIYTLIDTSLELLDVIDGGNTHVRLERELQAAVEDLQATLPPGERASYIAHQIGAMLRCKPQQRQEWSYYRAMTDEEFEEET